MYKMNFFHLSISRHLLILHLASICSPTIKWSCRYLFDELILPPLDMYTEVGYLDHVEVLDLVSQEPP